MQLESKVLWQPSEEVKRDAQLTRFIKTCGLKSYGDLQTRSVEDVAWFTERVLEFFNIEFSPPYQTVLDLKDGIAWPHWCVEGGLNISQTCLDRHMRSPIASQPAVIWEGEEGEARTWTYSELFHAVETCAAGLRHYGFGKGDAIALHLPMVPETVAALLAIARIGAVAVPLFSGYGPTAIASRLQHVAAKGVFTCDGFPRRGKTIHAKAVMDEALKSCPSVEKVFVIHRLNLPIPLQHDRDILWDDLLASGLQAPIIMRSAEPTLAEDPLILLYTSGTTGIPKGIVHTHCGFPIKAAQDMAFGTDVGPGDRISWVTDLGWMMGPWLIYGATLLGATMVLYDGAPDFPKADNLWAFCARHRVGILGISPSLVRALSTQDPDGPLRHDLSELRILASTGEPWNPTPWQWLFEKVGQKKLPIINYSGGTEISGGILMGNPLLPLKPCSFPAPCPGMAADVVDEHGESLRGAVGELVIRQPWIGMARGFWKDPARYLETYWSRFPELWVHGDFAEVDNDGHWFLLGRSDDTLKIAGKRVGPAEVESILVDGLTVSEAAVIGIPDEVKGQALIAFCVPMPKFIPPDLENTLMRRVATELGKPLRPQHLFFVSALPKTRNAKVMRRIIRAAFLGEDPGDLSALENPASVDAIKLLSKGKL